MSAPKLGDQLRTAFGRALSDGIDYTFEHAIHKPGEPPLFVRGTGHPVAGEDGKIVRGVGTCQDITA